ncbi:Probable ribosome biogenesis protein NEP1-like protein [Acidilobus saccharovorans 345-15]|uniref:Ribosomal RNA small subunit methyltransferase Nep1 n=1 Tax=Acidilobus saccharovorans (strain DSM 16705 / JCM 18335 / VKM B-2471 / 345-15) TaxID=666510 RepID=D9PZ22_ACIS3|nr:ribosome biogenesis protein [Acidilobus saccharovorans]ADL19809.1 Probable ribosome biogenesis protein NEP1-like protein [Acidilobus saccharovorans 345-15]
MLLLDSALEVIPRELASHPQVVKTARRYGLRPEEMVLDAGLHWKAMRSLEGWWRRGRPDIVHLSLLNLLEKRPVLEGKVEVYMHVQDGRVFAFAPDVRVPKNYDRFKGLMAQLLRDNRVPPSGRPLAWKVADSLRDFLGDRRIIVFSEGGASSDTLSVLREASSLGVPVGFGAFPRGDFSDEVKSLALKYYRIREGEPLKSWDVACSIANAYYEL